MQAPCSCLLRNCGRYVAESETFRVALTPIWLQNEAMVSVSFWMSGTVEVCAYVLMDSVKLDWPAWASSFLAPSASYGTGLRSGLKPGVIVGQLLGGVLA